MAQDAMNMLAAKLQLTMSAVQAERTDAENYLRTYETQAGFPVLLLQLVGTGANESVRQAGAVFFKNYVKRNWAKSEDDTTIKITEADREAIKTHLVALMLSTPVSVQRQLTEALAIISKHDFPQNWPSLLPELVARTADADFRVVNGVLQVANSIFKRYRTEFKSERLWQEIALVLQHFSAPLLTLFQRTLAAVMAPQNANDASALGTLFETVRLVCRIYLSLCSQDHPDFFASKVNEFWSTFLELLKYDNPLLASRDDDTPGVLERVKSAICEIACMFAEKYEEDFRSFVPPFVSQTWNMLTVIGDKGKYDEVCVKAIKFLTVVVSQQWHQELFGADHVLQTMCEKVVIPNIRLRETDIELFEMNGVEYVRRDIEGSDSDTRRRTTVDFVKGLCVCFEERITKILQGYTNVLLNNYAANPTQNWIDKDAAMYITLALTVQGSVQSTGVVKLNQYVDFGSFFTAHVMPELQRTDVNALPVLKADALKFVSVFRAQLPREALVTLMPLVVAHLRSTEFVVHTYAAHAIDRVLTVKEPGTNTLRLNRESMLPAIEPALGGLFAALQHPDSVENEYLMRAIMRVVATAKADIVPVLEPALRGAIGVLATVAQHPRNPAFNHALFETIASLVKNTCESQLGPTTTVSVTGVPSATPAYVAQFEQFLFPHFQTVLGMENCDEFAPYVFQLLAQLLEFRSDVSPAYQGIFPALLVPATWENHGSVPALVRLIEAYIVRDVAFIVRSNYTELVLGVFQKLIAAKQHDHHGLQLMSTLFEFLPIANVQQYLRPALTLCFQRLQAASTPKFTANFVRALAHLVHSRSAQVVISAMDSVQTGIFAMVLEKIWLPNAARVSGSDERKVCAVGTIDLLCRAPELMISGPYAQHWPKLLALSLELVAGSADDGSGADDEAVEQLTELAGHTSAFCRLAYAHGRDRDPAAQVASAAKHLAQSLAALSATAPGKLTGIIQQSLNDEQRAALGALLQQNQLTLQ